MCLGTGERHRPEAGDTGQRVPCGSLIGGPGRAAVVGGDDHSTAVVATGITALIPIAMVKMFPETGKRIAVSNVR